jgi:hypothetical protein
LISLTEFEIRLKQEFSLSDRDARRMDRAVTDISNATGMSKTEIFDFLKFGADTELSELRENYDWNDFYRSIVKKLKKHS